MKRLLTILLILSLVVVHGQSKCCKIIAGAVSDPDATAFLSATSITDPTITTATNNVVSYAKAHSFWTDFLHYPFVGGTSTTHSYNISLTSAYYLIWHGSWTHSASGAQGGGTGSDYAESQIIPSSFFLSKDNTSVTYYCNINDNSSGVEFGVDEGTTHILRIAMLFGSSEYSSANNAFVQSFSGVTDSRVCYTISRTSSTEFKIYVNGVLAATTTSTSDALAAHQLYLGAQNVNGPTQYPSTKRCAYLLIGPGVNGTTAMDIYTGLQAFETTLSRNN